MGDLRADIKIDLTMWGHKYKLDCWINYDGFNGPDRRVIEFFESSWDDAYSKYQRAEADRLEKEHAKDIRAGDEREFERLKKKLKK